MKAVALAPVSSITCFISAHAQSSVEHSARVHSATLLECAMCLTNGQVDTTIHLEPCQSGTINCWGAVCCHQHHSTRIEWYPSPAGTMHVVLVVVVRANRPQWVQSWCTQRVRDMFNSWDTIYYVLLLLFISISQAVRYTQCTYITHFSLLSTSYVYCSKIVYLKTMFFY